MSSKTTIPGYSGYIPNFQREYPTTKSTPAYKYEDINIPERTLMDTSQYISNYTINHGERSIVHPSRRRIHSADPPRGGAGQDDALAVKRNAENDANRQQTIDIRHAYEYEARPTYWTTSYATNFDAWKATADAAAARKIPDNTMTLAGEGGRSHIQPGSTLGKEDGGAYAHNMLRGHEQISSYQRSYGKFGDNPKKHYVESDGKRVFSRRATDADLFLGTAKNTVRIPGYGGFVPHSKNNINTIRQNVPYDTKDNMLLIYSHNLPKYTGHQPSAVINDRGPRNPQSKRPPPVGLHGSLVLETMKMQ